MNGNDLDSYLSKLATEQRLALNDLDQKQFVEAMRQMILSGDLRKNISVTGTSVAYRPYQGIELLRSENREMRRQLSEIRKVVNA